MFQFEISSGLEVFRRRCERASSNFQISKFSNYFFAAAAFFALNSSLIFSISTDFATGWKFWILRVVLLRADLALSLRFLRLRRVTAINTSFKRGAKIIPFPGITMISIDLWRKQP